MNRSIATSLRWQWAALAFVLGRVVILPASSEPARAAGTDSPFAPFITELGEHP